MKTFFGMTAAMLLVVMMLFVSLPGTAPAGQTNCENNNVVDSSTGDIIEECGVKKCVPYVDGAKCESCNPGGPTCCNQHSDCGSLCKKQSALL